MRRKEKKITEKAEIEDIVSRAKVCRLAMVENGEPYIVPLCFGYRNGAFYFHSAPEGRKIDILKKNTRVCFEIDVDVEVAKGKDPCKWGMRYKSVVGWGAAVLVSDLEQKREALNIIMAHYADEGESGFSYPDSILEKTAVIRVNVGSIGGKKS